MTRKINLPHIRHTVHFIDMSQLSGVEKMGAAYTAVQDENNTLVFIEDMEKNLKNIEFMPWLAHELVHVLQIICEKLHTNIENEKEHMAYIMHYLMEELITQ